MFIRCLGADYSLNILERVASSLTQEGADVRFGSLADICGAPTNVRFTPNSDRESRHPHTIMSALPPKADMCGAQPHVCFGRKADIRFLLTKARSQSRNACNRRAWQLSLLREARLT